MTDEKQARQEWVDYILGRIRAGQPLDQAQIDELEKMLGPRLERAELLGPAPEPEDEVPSTSGYEVTAEYVIQVPGLQASAVDRVVVQATRVLVAHVQAHHPEARAMLLRVADLTENLHQGGA